MERRYAYAVAATALLWGGLLVARSALSQPGPNAANPFGQATPTEAEPPSRVQLPGADDRVSARGLQQVRESIARGEFAESIRFLDELLARGEDIFITLPGKAKQLGLKEAVRQTIRELPPVGRQAYETAYGPTAQRMLDSAIANGNRPDLEQIVRRYAYTPAGYAAAMLLAVDDQDAGRHAAAAIGYRQLLNDPAAVRQLGPQLAIRAATCSLAAGDESRAREIIANLASGGRQPVEIAGRQRMLDSPDDPIAWLVEAVGKPAPPVHQQQRHWLTFRGNAARNAVSDGGLPHMRVRWDVQLLGPIGPPKLETLYEILLADRIQSGSVVPVAGAPLAVGDYILTRTLEGLLAVDFTTGKRVWRSEPERDPELAALVGATGIPEEEAAHPERAMAFARRMWDDYLYGQISSDGARAYLIRDLTMPPGIDPEIGAFMGGPVPAPMRHTNRLSAYELATQGKFVWEIDGATVGGELAGAYFLGPPVAVGDALYALVEIRGADVYLVALDPPTGKLLWRQQLAFLETDLALDVQRRLHATAPSYADGVLVCPTGAGVVLGVDLQKRSLAWAYRYASIPQPEMQFRRRAQGGFERVASHWLDSAVAIDSGRVLLTPPESDALHCIDLHNGKRLWTAKRDRMLRLACVADGRVVLVGNRRLTARQLSDGKPAWPKSGGALPEGAIPSGTGFVSDGKYFLPLTDAQVIEVDLDDGQIVSHAAARSGAPLGNLICHRGSVISQTGLSLDCYDQVEVLRTRSERSLADDPHNAEALRTLGEIAFNEGRLSDAIAHLERAHATAPDDFQTREVLAECLAAALDEDFTAYRARLPLLRELEDGSAVRRAQTLRIESKGLLAAGEPLPAAEACLALYRLAGPANELVTLSRDHQATVGRWVQAQLAAIWCQAGPDDRKILAAEFAAEQSRLGDSPSIDAIGNFLEFFGPLPSIEPLQLTYAQQLAAEHQTLESQQLMLRLLNSRDREISAAASDAIVEQLRQAGRHPAAAAFSREITFAATNGSSPDGKAADREATDLPVPQTAADWPTGRVEVTEMSSLNSGARLRPPMWGLRFEHTDPILGLCSGHYSLQGGHIVLQDNFGREFFTAALENDNQLHYRQQGSLCGASRGSLLVVSTGRQIVAFNALQSSDNAAATSLWRATVSNSVPMHDPYFGETAGASAVRPGTFRAPRTEVDGKWVGVIGPITSQGCVYQDQRRLVCCDAVTGEIRWYRTDVPAGCDLFGDDEVVFAVPADGTVARKFSAVDGRLLGEAKVPPFGEQLATVGRHIISWKRVSGDRMELASLDAHSGETVWRREFESGAAVDVDLGRYIAVVEPAGRAVVIDGEDGTPLVEQSVPTKPVVEEVHFTAGADAFLIVAKHRRPARLQRTVLPFNAIDSPVIDGQVYLFDRDSGEMRWGHPAEIVQQALLLNQPRDLPILAFAGTLNPDGGAVRPYAAVFVLDKRSGRTLYQSDKIVQAGQPQCLVRIADAAKPIAALELSGATVLLQFTDKRRPPEPPPLAEVEGDVGKSSRGIMGILEGIAN